MRTVDLRVELAAGTAKRRVLELREGQPFGPIGVGPRGEWKIDAESILPVHAHLHFDGHKLLVCSADAGSPARVGGRAVPASWVEVGPPAEIALGEARLRVSAIEPLEELAAATRRTPPPPRAAAAPVRPPPREKPVIALPRDDAEATRVHPIAVPPSRASLPDAAPSSAATPASTAAVGPASAPAPTGAKKAGAAAKPPGGAVARAWREASFPQRAILVLLPFAFVATWTMFDEEAPAPAKRAARPPASASAAPAEAAPAAVASVVATPAPAASAAPRAAADLAGKRTLERMAVDALAAGAATEAIALYDELATQHPDVPAYREAARILRARVAER